MWCQQIYSGENRMYAIIPTVIETIIKATHSNGIWNWFDGLLLDAFMHTHPSNTTITITNMTNKNPLCIFFFFYRHFDRQMSRHHTHIEVKI